VYDASRVLKGTTSFYESMGWHLRPPLRDASYEKWTNEGFLFEIRQGIAYLTLNEPNNNNSFSPTIHDGFIDSCRILRSRPDVRIAVLTGNGRMWCAGGDPKGFQDAQRAAGVIGNDDDGGPVDDSDAPEQTDLANNNPLGPWIVGAFSAENFNVTSGRDAPWQFWSWATIPQFSIVCMNGSAMGGALGILGGTDMVVAVKNAYATLSEVRLGVIPAVVSPNVIRTVGPSNAKRIFAAADNLNMVQAKEIGLVQRVVDKIVDFPAVVQEMAEMIQAIPPQYVATTKRAMFDSFNTHLNESLIEHLAHVYAKNRLQSECQEGVQAMVHDQKPWWITQKIDCKKTTVKAWEKDTEELST